LHENAFSCVYRYGDLIAPLSAEALMIRPSDVLEGPEVLEGVELKSLRPGSLIDVETKSRHYHIECLGGEAIRISGHPKYCPDPVPAHLQGSLDHDGALESGLIEPGMRMLVLLNDDHPVTTSRVISVHVDPPRAA
jgi:hypothetical protein